MDDDVRARSAPFWLRRLVLQHPATPKKKTGQDRTIGVLNDMSSLYADIRRPQRGDGGQRWRRRTPAY